MANDQIIGDLFSGDNGTINLPDINSIGQQPGQQQMTPEQIDALLSQLNKPKTTQPAKTTSIDPYAVSYTAHASQDDFLVVLLDVFVIFGVFIVVFTCLRKIGVFKLISNLWSGTLKRAEKFAKED